MFSLKILVERWGGVPRKILLVAGAMWAGVAGAQAAGKKPNLLFILSDDHSVPDVGCYGNAAIKTPNLDRFAAEGMRFTRMFTTAPQCVPSRASLLTGISPVAARISRFTSPLPADVVTLPELLRREAGYHTGVCRRGNHLDGPAMGPITKALMKEHDLMTFARRVDFVKEDSDREHTVAIFNQFLDSVPEGKPWFLWLNFNDPHHPWDAEKEAAGIDREKIKMPGYLPDLPGVRDELARFLGEVERMDEEFQRVLEVLKKRGLEENTLVVFMGDNGYALPRGKGSLYDAGLNVPCLVRWPGKVKAGTVADDLLSGEDVTPTFLEAAGVATPRPMTGRSFLGRLEGKGYEPREHVFAERGVHGKKPFTETTKSNTYDLSRCVRSDGYKLIYNCTPWMEYAPVDSEEDAGWQEMVAAHKAGTLAQPYERIYFATPRPIYEFYDLKKDPWELNNVSGAPEYAEAETKLRHALIEKMLIDFDYLPLPAE